ncbi:putative molybdenum carrier protein [Thiohalophilus sp.]|uniref:putative molybdenum carrier protein n=1 Tax=Thiohalophilus sp. TaxID=3028392 RepID=UPI002ACEE6DE|nr:putative molybdenum carrier protein [Thiohalophilus sp.]MDZ7662594.1 putative molybdenum carrier protein [Thiohalophilus sp.]
MTIRYLNCLISGGQTGVDRAALDVALELGLACGGWCPQGRMAEDGPIAAHYPLREVSGGYRVRTVKNVKMADGTLILNRGELAGGSRLTANLARKHHKPLFIIDLEQSGDPEAVHAWATTHAIQTLNIAGPGEHRCPGIHAQAVAYLKQVFESANRPG